MNIEDKLPNKLHRVHATLNDSGTRTVATLLAEISTLLKIEDISEFDEQRAHLFGIVSFDATEEQLKHLKQSELFSSLESEDYLELLDDGPATPATKTLENELSEKNAEKNRNTEKTSPLEEQTPDEPCS